MDATTSSWRPISSSLLPTLAAVTTLVVVALFSGAAWGGASYVAPAGSDDAVCSAEAPCASLSRAADLLVPGDTLYAVAGGDSAWIARLLERGSRSAGRYRSMLLQEPAGPRKVRGFVQLATTWATTLKPRFPSAARAIPNLVDALNRQTGIAAAVGKHVFIGSREFARSPFAYLTTARAFELTAAEVQSLGEYLRDGGFVFADNALASSEHSLAEASLRHMLVQALGRRGRLRRLPASHPIYHCFYEFDGPPPGLQEAVRTYDLQGLFLGGKLVGVFADKGYVHSWALHDGNEAQLRFGINAVVYALTREGSRARDITLLTHPTP